MFGVFHTLAVQTGPQDGGGSGLGVSLEIIAATVIACLLLTATVLLLGKYKRRRESMVLRERQARREMQELCPDGWAARIVLYGDGAPLPDDAPGERKVCVEWTEYEPFSRAHGCRSGPPDVGPDDHGCTSRHARRPSARAELEKISARR
jgi:hypothetical protein